MRIDEDVEEIGTPDRASLVDEKLETEKVMGCHRVQKGRFTCP
jgi:hypothetical protein